MLNIINSSISYSFWVNSKGKRKSEPLSYNNSTLMTMFEPRHVSTGTAGKPLCPALWCHTLCGEVKDFPHESCRMLHALCMGCIALYRQQMVTETQTSFHSLHISSSTFPSPRPSQNRMVMLGSQGQPSEKLLNTKASWAAQDTEFRLSKCSTCVLYDMNRVLIHI